MRFLGLVRVHDVQGKSAFWIMQFILRAWLLILSSKYVVKFSCESFLCKSSQNALVLHLMRSKFSAKSIDRSNFQIFKFSAKNQTVVKKNSSAWFSYFTEIRTVDFVKRCLKNVSVSYHWIMSPQQRYSWINRLRSQFYLRKCSRFNFLSSFSCKRFLLSSINLF